MWIDIKKTDCNKRFEISYELKNGQMLQCVVEDRTEEEARRKFLMTVMCEKITKIIEVE